MLQHSIVKRSAAQGKQPPSSRVPWQLVMNYPVRRARRPTRPGVPVNERPESETYVGVTVCVA